MLILSSTAEAYNFDKIFAAIRENLDENISDISKLPEVKYLSNDTLEELVQDLYDYDDYDFGDYDYERFFPRFETLASWMRSNEVNEDLKLKFTSMFDLKKFTSHQLTSSVREG